MIYADLQLARRLEAAEAANARGCNQGQPGAAVLEIAGGLAVFAGVESPLTQVVGMGLSGPVSAAQIDTMEAFFHCRGARVTVDLCPLADPGLTQALGDRGYRPTEFNQVLVKPLSGSPIVPVDRARRARPDEGELWSQAVGEAFFEQAELTNHEMNVGHAVFSMPGALCYLAITENGETAGGAAMAVHHGLATLFADGIVRRCRRQGLHGQLIAARIHEAIAQDCDLATASALPGSASQRNYERAGFQVAYTKVTLAG